jgi:ATPases involved in chromosome partitioning
MADQADKLRDLFNGKIKPTEFVAQNRTRIITIASGKGGVGKTSLTVNLAIALSKKGKKVMIMDADLGMANVDIMLGIVPKYTLFDVIQGIKSFKDIVIEGAEGIKLVPGCSGIFEAANIGHGQREDLVRELENYAREIDYILIDTGAGISQVVLGFIASADDVIIIITPEPTSITDGYGIIKILSRFKLHQEVHLVINMANNFQEAQESARKIEIVADKYLHISIKRLGVMYLDNNVKKSIKEMIPFMIRYPHSQVSQDVMQIASNILEQKIGFDNGGTNFAQKLIGLFK